MHRMAHAPPVSTGFRSPSFFPQLAVGKASIELDSISAIAARDMDKPGVNDAFAGAPLANPA